MKAFVMLVSRVLILASSLCGSPAFAEITSDNWSYAGAGNTTEAYWPDIAGSFCGDSAQSPINIVTEDAQDTMHAPFNIDTYAITMDATVKNTGHSLEVEFPGSEAGGYYDVTGGGLIGTFRAVQLHFHFGSVNTQGSEHTVDGKQYPAEMHIVHYDTQYASGTEAKQHKGGFAVLGFFLEEDDDDDNSALDIILNEVSNVLQAETHVDITGLKLADLLPSSLDQFWRYEGSLTTPLCNEVVTWTLFKDTIKISTAQLNILRTLQSESHDVDDNILPMANNYRSVQSLGSRTVYDVEADDSDDGDNDDGSAGQLNQSKMVVLSSILMAIFVIVVQ